MPDSLWAKVYRILPIARCIKQRRRARRPMNPRYLAINLQKQFNAKAQSNAEIAKEKRVDTLTPIR